MIIYAEYLLRHLTGGLVQYGMLGDWLSIESGFAHDGDDVRRVSAFSATMNFVELTEMATATKRTADAKRYGEVATRMKQARCSLYHGFFHQP
jgi:hypothetical protein